MKITVNIQFFDYLSSSQSLIIAWMWNPPQEFNFTSFFYPSNSNFNQSHRQIKPMLAREKNTKNRPDSFVFWWLRKIVYKHWKSTRLIDQSISSWHLCFIPSEEQLFSFRLFFSLQSKNERRRKISNHHLL